MPLRSSIEATAAAGRAGSVQFTVLLRGNHVTFVQLYSKYSIIEVSFMSAVVWLTRTKVYPSFHGRASDVLLVVTRMLVLYVHH